MGDFHSLNRYTPGGWTFALLPALQRFWRTATTTGLLIVLATKTNTIHRLRLLFPLKMIFYGAVWWFSMLLLGFSPKGVLNVMYMPGVCSPINNMHAAVRILHFFSGNSFKSTNQLTNNKQQHANKKKNTTRETKHTYMHKTNVSWHAMSSRCSY